MVHRRFRRNTLAIQSGDFVDEDLQGGIQRTPTLTIRPASLESHGSASILRCAQLSLASLILLTLESCSSPPRSRANGPAGPSRVTMSRTEASTASLGSSSSVGRWAAAQARSRGSIAHSSTSTAPLTITPRPGQLGQSGVGSRRIDRIGLVSGEWNGTFARISVDLHNEVDADQLALELSASGGPLQTLDQIIHRPGVDVGLVQADALERLMRDDPSSNARQYLRYIASLYDETVHVVARADITNLRQLDGHKINVGKAGSSSDITARLLFEKLGIGATFTNDDVKDALDHLVAGDIDAAVILAPSPAWEVLVFQTEGFRLVPIPWEPAVGDVYKPAELGYAEYPTLIAEGQAVPTVKVSVVLAVYNWRKGSPGWKRVERFASSLFARVEHLRRPGHHFAWNEVDLSEDVPGWERFETKGPEGRPKQAAPAASKRAPLGGDDTQ
jgi:TRAP-type uncharacterized transport system substrate-binding protein